MVEPNVESNSQFSEEVRGFSPELDSELDDIASAVSYELRTPLTSIRAALGLLLTGMLGTLPEKGQRMLEIAFSNTERLMRLVDVLESDVESDGEFTAFHQLSGSEPLLHQLAALSWQQKFCNDELTALPTPMVFMRQLRQAIAIAQADQTLAILLVDVDRFNVINDSLGREVGDQLLRAIAQRLILNLPLVQAITHLREDEFGIFLEQIEDTNEAIAVAEKIQQAFASPFNFNGQDVFLSVSIGIATGTKHDQSENLLHNAYSAVYQAKALGKARYELFDAELRVKASSRLRLETDLRLALARQEFQLYYQPIVAVATGKISGFEALIRWRHPQRGLVTPTKFIPLAEEMGLVSLISQWVLHQACSQLHQWQQQFPSQPPLTISVNLSAQQFSKSDLPEQVQQILQETGLDSQSLKIEITESAIMHSLETATAVLEQLKALGVQLYVDDFGTGYSSLAYLHRLPIDKLKIDRSFITRIDSEGEQLEIVRAIVKLAWNLGMDVIAEGVETASQLAQLKALRCEYVQGFFFSKPLDRTMAEALLRQGLVIRA
ncbi:EAL domain-containing protein [Leptolyngbya sp. FACHB-541]|uniref:EAL domain-containing protein n=1 Tax=Leptolyngbya sp. FACHB-541 TaxID=2692810 RepID=UPI0016899F9A|nr:EAL domain-containing protein [Leptolyngbya sp. FACHB-541]MBD1996887.1 EAL domain-containing protein [Leptolyngbya sp. FACHB-541]